MAELRMKIIPDMNAFFSQMRQGTKKMFQKSAGDASTKDRKGNNFLSSIARSLIQVVAVMEVIKPLLQIVQAAVTLIFFWILKIGKTINSFFGSGSFASLLVSIADFKTALVDPFNTYLILMSDFVKTTFPKIETVWNSIKDWVSKHLPKLDVLDTISTLITDLVQKIKDVYTKVFGGEDEESNKSLASSALSVINSNSNPVTQGINLVKNVANALLAPKAYASMNPNFSPNTGGSVYTPPSGTKTAGSIINNFFGVTVKEAVSKISDSLSTLTKRK